MPEDHEVLVVGTIDEENKHKTPDYDTTMDLVVTNIDKNDKNMEENLQGNE